MAAQRNIITVSAVENIVQTPPPGMTGWRFYRLEYSNGIETAIWLPPGVDTIDIEHTIEMSQ